MATNTSTVTVELTSTEAAAIEKALQQVQCSGLLNVEAFPAVEKMRSALECFTTKPTHDTHQGEAHPAEPSDAPWYPAFRNRMSRVVVLKQ